VQGPEQVGTLSPGVAPNTPAGHVATTAVPGMQKYPGGAGQGKLGAAEGVMATEGVSAVDWLPALD